MKQKPHTTSNVVTMSVVFSNTRCSMFIRKTVTESMIKKANAKRSIILISDFMLFLFYSECHCGL